MSVASGSFAAVIGVVFIADASDARSLVSGVLFLLVGLSLVLFSAGRCSRLARTLAIVAGVLSALVGIVALVVL